MKEKKAFYLNGYLAIVISIAVIIVGAVVMFKSFSLTDDTVSSVNLGLLVIGIILWVIAGLFLSSMTIIAPNHAKVITFFGQYVGTIPESGLFITLPLSIKQTVSLRVRNFNSNLLKVNDLEGNPVEIAAVIVFRVTDTAKALFEVENYEQFVEIQSEAAIRHLASEYSYDSFSDESVITLRGNTSEVSEKLQKELEARLTVAGVEIVETRLTHLAYATEIASAMLQRQQAKAILSARQIIVEGAVSMTQLAIEQLEKDSDLVLTEDRKVQLINNMLVSIITDRGTQPVINTGDTN